MAVFATGFTSRNPHTKSSTDCAFIYKLLSGEINVACESEAAIKALTASDELTGRKSLRHPVAGPENARHVPLNGYEGHGPGSGKNVIQL